MRPSGTRARAAWPSRARRETIRESTLEGLNAAARKGNQPDTTANTRWSRGPHDDSLPLSRVSRNRRLIANHPGLRADCAVTVEA